MAAESPETESQTPIDFIISTDPGMFGVVKEGFIDKPVLELLCIGKRYVKPTNYPTNSTDEPTIYENLKSVEEFINKLDGLFITDAVQEHVFAYDFLAKLKDILKTIFCRTELQKTRLLNAIVSFMNEPHCDDPRAIGSVLCRFICIVLKRAIKKSPFARIYEYDYNAFNDELFGVEHAMHWSEYGDGRCVVNFEIRLPSFDEMGYKSLNVIINIRKVLSSYLEGAELMEYAIDVFDYAEMEKHLCNYYYDFPKRGHARRKSVLNYVKTQVLVAKQRYFTPQRKFCLMNI